MLALLDDLIGKHGRFYNTCTNDQYLDNNIGGE